MSNFRPVDRDTGFLMPPLVDEWLPERHLSRFVVEAIAGLDLRAMTGSYRGSGEAPRHPELLLGILVHGYATEVFSSRKLERAAYDSAAFRCIAANDHPDHDTIAAFRRHFLKQIETLFVRVLVLAREMGVVKLGTVALDGTKIHANASGHSALSYEHAGKIEVQLKAEAADQADVPDGMSIPEELARREERLAKLARARATIEARAKQRHARERGAYEAKLAARQAKTAATGKKPRGKRPAPPQEGPLPNDRQQMQPMLGKVAALPEELGKAETLLADTGYFSDANVQAWAAAGSEPLIAMGRQPHHQSVGERFAPAPTRPDNPTPVEAMAYRLKTPEGKKLYGLCKQMPEPVFGLIKSALGFRQFLLCGLDNVRGEWSLVTMAWNMKRMFALGGAN
jgi:transposase